MKITLVRDLIAKYGRKFIDNTLSNQEVEALLDPATFDSNIQDVDVTQSLTDKNFSAADAMRLFVLELRPHMEKAIMISIVKQLIQKTNAIANEHAFIQKTSLIKLLLAQINIAADQAEQNSVTELVKLLASKITTKSETTTENLLKAVQNQSLSLVSSNTRIEDALKKGPESIIAEPVAAEVSPSQAKSTGLFNFARRGRSDSYAPAETTQQGYVKSLTAFASEYHKGALLEAGRREAKVNGVQKSTWKVRVAEDLIPVIKDDTTDDEIITAFQESLIKHKFSAKQFFGGKTKEKLKNDALYTLLRSPFAAELDAVGAQEAPVKTPFTFGALFAGKKATDISTNPNASFIVELRQYAKHYSNTTTQLHQSLMHKDKKTSKGILEAAAKVYVANELIKGFENQNPNIAQVFLDAMLEVGFETKDQFFDCTKLAVKLSDELKALFPELLPKVPASTINYAGDGCF